ncbi:MAG: protein FxsA, partial [Mycobacterium sp.]|nr:protein FxsA [Mycobacterium sp.]
RWFLVYVVVEMAAIVALTWAVGLGWTLLVLLATFALGIALAGSQLKRQVRRMRAGFDSPQGAITDSALIALGTVLVVVPGIVTSALGVLLLLPPTRAAARPLVAMLAARRIPVMATRRRDYIDGEVIDVVDVEPPALPRAPS